MTRRVHAVRRRGPPLPAALKSLRRREGSRPQTTPRSPHLQLTDLGRQELARELVARVAALPGVAKGPSLSSPESEAFFVSEWEVRQPRSEAPFGGEFAHAHVFNGGSVHLVLPEPWGAHASHLGWAERHPDTAEDLAPPVLFLAYGPRHAEDVAALYALLRTAYAHILALDPDDPALEDGRYLLHHPAPHHKRHG